MKKALILISMVAISSVTLAQQGSWYIGGLVGFSSSKSEDSGSGIESVGTNWWVSPEAGTFLRDDIQLGIALGIGGSKNTVDGDDVSKTTQLDPTIYGRKFFKITDNFSTFAGLYIDLISHKTTDYNPTLESTTSGFGARVGAGVAFALSPRFTAVGQYGVLGFQSTKDKVDGDEVSKNSDFDFGVNSTGG
ncbi:MAG TPA: outer membrane beta-barrel protein, partial [Cyclobacteriaceae bacterium]|nr:outer membrane beta-barrel protein [Cyclobacteriaceae bacterium]